jgi:peptidoglycan/LPS O-acetylase OafA/YrhL
MIQRIQSIYLLAASLVLFALFLFPVVNNLLLNGHADSIMASGIYEVINGVRTKTSSLIYLTIATIIAALLPLAGIFMYKNRKQQSSYCYIAIVLIIGYSFYLAETVKDIVGAGITLKPENYGLGIILPSLAIVLIILGIRNINKDEKLVRSADRLR